MLTWLRRDIPDVKRLERKNGRAFLQQRLESGEYYAVVLAGSGKVIGNIYCGKRDFNTKKVGYIINGNYRRMGYAGEALSAVMENEFRQGVHRIYAECDPRNTASWKLLEKSACGGRLISDRTSGFLNTRTENLSGKTPTSMQN